MNESFVLNQTQERDLLCSIYEYFLWRKEQVNDKLSYSATNYYNGKTCVKNDHIRSEYVRYQSVIEVLNKKFSHYESDFKNMNFSERIPRLIKALFVVDDFKSQQQTNRKPSSISREKYNKSNHNCSPKLKRKIDNKENKAAESFKAKKRSRVSITTSPADINNTKTTLSDATSTTVCDNTTKNDEIDCVKNKKKSTLHSETVENLHTRKETPVTFSPTIDSYGHDNTPGAASNASDSIKAKKKSRVHISSPANTNTKTTLSDATSTLCENAKNDDIDSVKDKKKSTHYSETSESLPTQKETPATSLPTMDSNHNNDNAPGAASSASDSKSEKRQFASFDERFKDLEHFKAGNGHTRVPVRTSLGQWVNRIRGKKRQMEQGKHCHNPLSKEQIERLESLGFEWKVATPAVPFEQRLEALKKFKEIEGHCDVPRSYENDPSLGNWVHDMRNNYARKAKSLTAERIEKLESLGFNWVVFQKQKSFEHRLEECRNYRRKHGHLKVPTLRLAPKCQTEEEGDFLVWANTQRKEYKRWKAGLKSKINKSKINKLDEIGFDWTYGIYREYKPKPYVPMKPKEKETWDGRLKELKEVKEKVGSCNSLPDFVKAGYTEQSRLYQWMKLQRKKHKFRKLSEEQVSKLKELDFDFEPRRHYAPYGSKKEAAKAQKAKESKDQQSLENEGDCQPEDNSTHECTRNDDETASESDNGERNESIQLQNNVATPAHVLFQGFGMDSCRF